MSADTLRDLLSENVLNYSGAPVKSTQKDAFYQHLKRAASEINKSENAVYTTGLQRTARPSALLRRTMQNVG